MTANPAKSKDEADGYGTISLITNKQKNKQTNKQANKQTNTGKNRAREGGREGGKDRDRDNEREKMNTKAETLPDEWASAGPTFEGFGLPNFLRALVQNEAHAQSRPKGRIKWETTLANARPQSPPPCSRGQDPLARRMRPERGEQKGRRFGFVDVAGGLCFQSHSTQKSLGLDSPGLPSLR